MFKRFLVSAALALLAMAPALSTAQTAPAASAAGSTTLPSCYPKTLGGTGTVMLATDNQYGKVIYYHCPGKFEWTSIIVACPASATCGPNFPQLLSDVAMIGMPAALTKAWNTQVVAGLTSTPELKQLTLSVLDEVNGSRPAAPGYVVAKNGTYTTRPVFPFVPFSPAKTVNQYDNGVRTAVTAGTVPVGTACDCSSRIMVGTSAYCAVAGSTAKVVTGTKYVTICASTGK